MKAQRSRPTKKKSVKDHVLDAAFGIITGLNAIFPKLKWVSMCSTPDFADNARALYEYMQTCDDPGKLKDHTVVWHVADPETAMQQNRMFGFAKYPVRFVRKNRLASLLSFMLSDYVISTHGLYSMIKLTNRQTSLYLTHGVPVKKFGFEYENDVRIGVQHADYALATSPFYQDVISRSMGIDKSRVWVSGLPRDDVFFTKDNRSQGIYSLLSRKYIVYLPTYRVSNGRNIDNGIDLNSNGNIFGASFQDWITFNEFLLENDLKIVIKPHPLEKKTQNTSVSYFSQVILIDDEWIMNKNLSLNEILRYSEALITDYSGVMVDYLLTQKPIVFYLPDYNEYKDSRGYVFEDLLNEVPGPTVSTFSELRGALLDDGFKEKREKAKQRFNVLSACTASAQVFDMLFGND